MKINLGLTEHRLPATQPSPTEPPSHIPANADTERAALKYIIKSQSDKFGCHFSSSFNSSSSAQFSGISLGRAFRIQSGSNAWWFGPTLISSVLFELARLLQRSLTRFQVLGWWECGAAIWTRATHGRSGCTDDCRRFTIGSTHVSDRGDAQFGRRTWRLFADHTRSTDHNLHDYNLSDLGEADGARTLNGAAADRMAIAWRTTGIKAEDRSSDEGWNAALFVHFVCMNELVGGLSSTVTGFAKRVAGGTGQEQTASRFLYL